MTPLTTNVCSPAAVVNITRRLTDRPLRSANSWVTIRIWLRQKHERIVDDFFVAAFQVIAAQAAIACHVHAKNQQISLTL